MADEQQPSKNPADAAGGLAGMLRIAIDKVLQEKEWQLPARVISYDKASNVAKVQPIIAMVGTDGTLLSRAPLASIPVLSLGGGGFTLRFPVKPGDSGWIEASDRDISLYLQSGADNEAKPHDMRMHCFSHGRFIPDTFAKALVADENTDRVVLQNLAGDIYIAIGDDGVHVKAPLAVIDAPVIFRQEAQFDARITATGGMTLNGIDQETHRHGGVQTGGGTSGTPVA